MKTTKAKNEYRCDLCELTIHVGTDYCRHKGLPWEHADVDDFFTLRYHVPCEAECQSMMADTDDVLTDEDLRELYRERHGSAIAAEAARQEELYLQPALPL